MVEPISIGVSVGATALLIVGIIGKLCKKNSFSCSSECCNGNCKASIKQKLMSFRRKRD